MPSVPQNYDNRKRAYVRMACLLHSAEMFIQRLDWAIFRSRRTGSQPTCHEYRTYRHSENRIRSESYVGRTPRISQEESHTMNVNSYVNAIKGLSLTAAFISPIPDTKCASCKYAEYTSFQRIWLGYPVEGYTGVFRTMFAAIPYNSYEYHRNLWIEYGDIKELERMLRHIS